MPGRPRDALPKGQGAYPSGWLQSGGFCLSPERARANIGYPAGAVAGLTAEKLRSGRLLVNPRDRLRGGEQ
jgi:hypothetical protein